jgi:C1A family cysteine protease
LLAVAFVAPALASGSPSVNASGVAAPLDAAYLRSLISLPSSVLSAAAGGQGLGLRPAPQQALAFTGAQARQLAVEAAAPASYDLRSSSRVSSVKDQGALGTCWAFAACGSLESALLPGESADFAEDNMVLTSGFDNGGDAYNWGGNIGMAAAYLTRWGGPVNEAEDKYGDGYTPARLSARKHVQEVTLIPARGGPGDNTAIKDAVVQYGGAYVSMGWYGSSSGSDYYKAATSSYYYGGSESTNHGVLIVGWDDTYAASNFATTPPGSGAFLVKNSWGLSWGAGGYFWASYYDSNFGRVREMAVFNGSEAPTNYTGIYQYDPLGDCNSYGFSGSSTAWFANVFTAQANASLSAVGFWTLAPGSSYQVYLGPSLAAKALASSGTLATMGFHTVSLPTPSAITGGQPFIVAVKITSPGSKSPVAIEAPYSSYSSKATASAGQSYVSADGATWSDLTGKVANANVCLKAYVSGSSTPVTPTVSGFTPTSGPVGTVVTVSGSGFTGLTGVSFGGVNATTYSAASATQLTATVPAGALDGQIAVSTGAGSGSSAAAFDVTVPVSGGPVISGFTPVSGVYRTTVVVTGSGFSGATRVTFNGRSSYFVASSPTQIKTSVPYGATTGLIAVTTRAGTGYSLAMFYVR